jgi:hypothetical protein
MTRPCPAYPRNGNNVKNLAMSGQHSHGEHAQQSVDQVAKKERSIVWGKAVVVEKEQKIPSALIQRLHGLWKPVIA